MFFKPLQSAYFGPVSLGPPFAKFQKTGDLGFLAELVRTRRWRHFWSRDFAQDVVQGLHLKRILIIRSGHLQQGIFQVPKVGLFLGQFALQNIRKRTI